MNPIVEILIGIFFIGSILTLIGMFVWIVIEECTEWGWNRTCDRAWKKAEQKSYDFFTGLDPDWFDDFPPDKMPRLAKEAKAKKAKKTERRLIYGMVFGSNRRATAKQDGEKEREKEATQTEPR